MLRLLALALLLPTLAQAQSDSGISLFPCLDDAEFEDLYSVIDDPEPFLVWGELAGFQDDREAKVCRGATIGEDDAPSPLYTIDDEGGLLLDAIVQRHGRPMPFAVVTATARDERGGPVRLAAVGVANEAGEVTMVLPPSRHATRLTVSEGGEGEIVLCLKSPIDEVGRCDEWSKSSVFISPSEGFATTLAVTYADSGDEGGLQLAARAGGGGGRFRGHSIRQLRKSL